MSGDIAQRVLEGDRRALTRILTWVENGYPEARDALRSLFPHTGRAHIVGVTGPTGSGKSTLLGALAREYRNMDRSVGIVAIDPTSPFSHGAILGDRIRMQDLTSDPESNGRLETLVDAIVERELDPHTAAEHLIANP